MEGLERTSEIQAIIRRKVATLVTVCAVIMTILDIALFIYNLELDLFRDGPLPFFVQRVLTPLIVNFGLVVTAQITRMVWLHGRFAPCVGYRQLSMGYMSLPGLERGWEFCF